MPFIFVASFTANRKVKLSVHVLYRNVVFISAWVCPDSFYLNTGHHSKVHMVFTSREASQNYCLMRIQSLGGLSLIVSQRIPIMDRGCDVGAGFVPYPRHSENNVCRVSPQNTTIWSRLGAGSQGRADTSILFISRPNREMNISVSSLTARNNSEITISVPLTL